MNYFLIAFNIVSLLINIIVIIVYFLQIKAVKSVASSIPFLEFKGPLTENGTFTYKLINRGPGHAKNINLYICNKSHLKNYCKGPTFMPYIDKIPEIKHNYEGQLVIYPTSWFVVEYESMTGYKTKNIWKLKDGAFQIC